MDPVVEPIIKKCQESGCTLKELLEFSLDDIQAIAKDLEFTDLETKTLINFFKAQKGESEIIKPDPIDIPKNENISYKFNIDLMNTKTEKPYCLITSYMFDDQQLLSRYSLKVYESDLFYLIPGFILKSYKEQEEKKSDEMEVVMEETTFVDHIHNIVHFEKWCQDANMKYKKNKGCDIISCNLLHVQSDSRKIIGSDIHEKYLNTSLEMNITHLKYTIKLVLEFTIPEEYKFIKIPKIPIGTRVIRGKDWEWKDEDGGKESVGVVIGYKSYYGDGEQDGVYVWWEGIREVKDYRFGYGGFIDLDFASHNIITTKDILNKYECNDCNKKIDNELTKYCKICNLCENCIEKQPSCCPSEIGIGRRRIKCVCGCYLIKTNCAYSYSESSGITCNSCSNLINSGDHFYHCLRYINPDHFLGNDYCLPCSIKYVEDDYEKPSMFHPLVVAAIGECGGGKSTLCNKILGKTSFKTSSNNNACTLFPEGYLGNYLGKNHLPWTYVIDTPGLSDPQNRDEQFMIRAAKFFKEISYGINAFLLVINGTEARTSKHLIDSCQLLQDKLTPRFWDNVIIVYTYCDSETRDMWERNIPAHFHFSQYLKEHFGFEAKPPPLFHVSSISNRNFDKLLEAIQERPRFRSDWLDKIKTNQMVNFVKGMVFLRSLLDEVSNLGLENEKEVEKENHEAIEYSNQLSRRDSRSNSCLIM